MCGIAGQITTDRRPVDGRMVAAMGARLRHRGPDDEGLYVKGHVGLAHRRLSILDVSPAGHQPMSNDAGTVWVVFNGEIYNYRELRGQLRSPRSVRSRTDTEVLLYLYEDYGVRCFELIRGMFAVAIWDERNQRLLLARDRLGKKPLFYALRNKALSFASELKALLVEEPRPEIDPVALHHYLTFQYVPAPQTIYRDVRKLLPGHVLVYEDGKLTDNAYWELSYGKGSARRSDEDYREEFRALLTESVRLRLVSDVPLGAFLSGGVDSSSVVALMSRLTDRPVKTFSIGFKEEAFNELPYARQVAERFATDHHEFVVEPSTVEILPALARVYDEPFADSSAIPTYYLAQLTRQFVTVALNGDGGDELLGGYPRYRFDDTERLLSSIASDRTRERLRGWLARIPRALPGIGRLRSSLEPLLTPLSRTYLRRICYFSPEEKAALYTDEFLDTVRRHDSLAVLDGWFDQARASDLLDRLLAVDTRSYLPDDLLVKVDRATMAHGLEARSPLLDHRLMEFAAALPVDQKVREGEGKYLLKSAMRELLPEPVTAREKMGFAVPLDRWYRSECRDFVRDTLLSARSLQRGYFKPERIRELLDREQGGASAYGARVHALLMLELWHREYMDGRPSREAEPAGRGS
jgi:asparagine synthase (glutamine-hydrolysing)